MNATLWSTPWFAVFAAVVLSGCCYAAIAGLGSWFAAKDRLEALGLGLAAQGFIFGSFGLLGAPLKVLTAAILALGYAGVTRFLRLPAGISILKTVPLKTRWAQLTLLLMTIFVVSRFLFALYPQLQADPLAYHVEAPKIWAQEGTLHFISWLPWGLQSGAFEYFYTLIATITQDPVLLLLTAQISHVVVGTLLSALVILTLCELVGLRKDIALLVTLACLVFPLDATMMVRAKNDGATLFFSLLALRSLLSHRSFWLCGIFAGAAVAAKWSGLFFVLPLMLFANHLSLEKPSLPQGLVQLAKLSVCVLLLAAPLALRNWLWTDDPLFPAMGRVFPSPQLNAILLAEVEKYTYLPTRWHGLLQKAQWYLWAVPPLCLALLLPFVKPSRPSWYLLGLGLTIVLLFAGVSGVAAGPRFCLIAVVLFALSAGVVWQKLATRFSFAPWVILAAMLANTEFDVPVSNVFKRSVPFWLYKNTALAFIHEANPLIQFQTKINAMRLTPPPTIMGCQENEALFLNGGMTIPYNHRGGAEALAAKDPLELAQRLKTAGMSHLLLKKASPTPCWQALFRETTFFSHFQVALEDKHYVLYRRME